MFNYTKNCSGINLDMDMEYIEEEHVAIYNTLPDFNACCKYIHVNEWDNEAPLKLLPDSVIKLQINCNYNWY